MSEWVHAQEDPEPLPGAVPPVGGMRARTINVFKYVWVHRLTSVATWEARFMDNST